MKRSLISLALLSGLVLTAHATPGGEHNNTGCNGKGNANSPCTGSGGAGGAGGQGGAGGNATAGALAAAQASASANAASIAAQQQRQAQRQQQTATGGNATATGGSATGGNSYATSGGNVLTQQGGAVTVEGDTYVAPAQERNPASTAYAAPLTATNGTCMGSSSAGGQGAAFGVSFGTTWTDSSCDIRYDAEALRAAGLPLAARERLCQKADIAKAMEAAGTPCRGAKRAGAAPSEVTAAASLNLLP